METATIHVPPAEIQDKIRRWILPGKPGETPLRNILCYLGLYTNDFPDGKKSQIMWDENEITISSKAFPVACNCDQKDPKVVAIDEGWHSPRCNLAMAWTLMHHRDLVDMEDDDETARTTWTFQWPRSLKGRREVIQVVFTEVADDGLWEAHQETWRHIVALMPDPRVSLAERASLGLEDEDDGIEVPADLPDAPPLDYDFDMDLSAPAPEPEPEIVWTGDMPEVPMEDLAKAVDEALGEPEQPRKGKKRGRPFGTTKAAKNAAIEIGSVQVEDTPEGKRVPICQKFAAMMDDELVYLGSMTKTIREAEAFPKDAVAALKNLLDRLALRAAHLEARRPHDSEEAKPLSPIIETTLLNVSAQTKAAVRDLGLAPENPLSWETYVKSIKEVASLADALHDVVSQTGISPYITEQSD